MQKKQNIHETDGRFVTQELPEKLAEAMAAKRRELITQPLDRIWLDLANAAIAAMPGWQPIETAPKDGTEVLVYVPRRMGALYMAAGNITGVQWWSRNLGAITPSHWMPLPPAPEAQP